MEAAAVLEAHSFLFTDIVGSTLHWERADRAMHAALTRHDEIVCSAIAANGGRIMHSAGDGFCSAFPTPVQSLKTAITIHKALAAQAWPETGPLHVRAAIHWGEAYERGGDYFGPSVNRTARILSLAHGQQTLVSEAAYQQVRFAAAANEVILRDLGIHRMKDLQEPEHIWQASHVSLPYEFPPLQSLDHYPNNLPQFLSSFVGRERDLEEVVTRLRQNRLVTLTGFGGAGKTRLSLQAAANLQEDFLDGIWLARLEALPGPTLVAQEIASALHIREQAGTPLLASIAEHLQDRQTLLVLDNCEHVLDECSAIVSRLLAECPDLRVMATSRQALGIAGENTFHVRPLGVPPVRIFTSVPPDPADLLRVESVRLFAERAILVQPRFAITPENCRAIAQICQSLDGIPLAIELAAARVRAMSVNQIADRVEDRFRLLTSGRRDVLPRHQTLRALIEWSSDLLTDAERVLFSRMAVFSSGWTLEACEQVCAGGSVESWLILDLLTALVDKSLVINDYIDGQYRYSLLETVHDYCWERLKASGEEEAMRDRHRDYFVTLAETLAPRLAEGNAAAVAQIEVEHDNLRAAIDYCVNSPASGHAVGLRLACALERFWEVRGYCREGRRHFDALLARAEGNQPDALSAQALTGAGILAFRSGDFDSARDLHEASLAIWQQLSDEPRVAEALENLGNVAEDQGQFEDARELYTRALAINRKVQNPASEALNLGNLASASAMLDDFDAADRYIDASLTLSRRIGNQRCIGFALYCAGLTAYRRGDYAEARRCHSEGLAVWQAFGSRLGIAFSIEAFFELAAAVGEMEKSLRMYAAAAVVRQAIGEPPPPVREIEYRAVLFSVKEQLEGDVYAAEYARGQSMSIDEAIADALGGS